MTAINTYSVLDLAAFVVIATLALIFQVSYWFVGRRTIDLFFSNWLVLIAAFCMFVFIEDNIIPENTQVRDTPNGPALTLFWLRMNYTMGLLGMATQLHFIFYYCESRWAKPRYIGSLYGAAVLLLPVVWASPWFLTKHVREPGENSVASWANIVPDMPSPGPLVVAFLITWLVVQVISLVILRRRRLALAGTAPGGPLSLSQINFVRVALIVIGLGGIFDTLASLTSYSSISLMTPASIGLAAFVSIALVRERRAAEHHAVHMEAELRIAADIQSGLLPQGQPAVTGFDVAGWSRPAEMAGGDTYDVFQLPDGRWLITLADASDHGLGPALIVDETRAILRALTVECVDAATILTHARRLLAPDLSEAHFVTCFVGLLDPASATLSYASAGQGPIIFYESARGQFRGENPAALPLLSFTSPEFDCAVRQQRFEPGDFLALVSDGLYEASDLFHNQFGIARLFDALRKGPRVGVQEVISHVRKEVEEFMRGGERADDMTMLVLRKQ